MAKTPRDAKRRRDKNSTKTGPRSSREGLDSSEAIRAAEQVALAAFGSGLRLAAAFGSAAAKTTSLALASLAMGADKFSEMVRHEALYPLRIRSSTRPPRKSRRPITAHKRK